MYGDETVIASRIDVAMYACADWAAGRDGDARVQLHQWLAEPVHHEQSLHVSPRCKSND